LAKTVIFLLSIYSKKQKMAKIKPGIISIDGKFGDNVVIDSRRYGKHMRKAPAAGSKKEEEALKEQYSRTASLNKLASELNKIIKAHCPEIRNSRFYEQLQSRFRKEPLNNRFLLLTQLKGMNINPNYPLTKLGSQTITVTASKNKLSVNLKVELHPEPGSHRANCYYYEVLLLSWDKIKKPARYNRQFSEWVHLEKDKPEFEFEFERTAGTKNWLLCLRQRLGVNEQLISAMVTDGMQIIGAGTFDKKEEALLIQRQEEEEKKEEMKSVGRKVVENVVRVKAKKQ
jgi:hypothetical protein